MSKTYVFDIDGTVCTITDGNYEEAKPFPERISQINELYNDGNTIIFYTARGMGRSMNQATVANDLWRDLTLRQLSDWCVSYHALFLGKPSGDIYVDDKGVRDTDFFR